MTRGPGFVSVLDSLLGGFYARKPCPGIAGTSAAPVSEAASPCPRGGRSMGRALSESVMREWKCIYVSSRQDPKEKDRGLVIEI